MRLKFLQAFDYPRRNMKRATGPISATSWQGYTSPDVKAVANHSAVLYKIRQDLTLNTRFPHTALTVRHHGGMRQFSTDYTTFYY